jgi:hypothetical protein
MGGAFLAFPTGRAIAVATTRPIFRKMQIDWILGMILPPNVAMTPWENTVATYVP